jgi:hypothetical protein
VVITWGSEPDSRLEEIARTVVETPFTRRTWSELLFMMAGMPIAFIGIAFVGITMAAGGRVEIGPLGLGITLPAGTERDVIAEINRVLVEGAISVYRLQEVQTSLESWFLQVTKRLGESE